MEQKRDLSMDELEKVTGGTGEAYGIDTDYKSEPIGIPDENQFYHNNIFGLGQKHPVRCSNCGRL